MWHQLHRVPACCGSRRPRFSGWGDDRVLGLDLSARFARSRLQPLRNPSPPHQRRWLRQSRVLRLWDLVLACRVRDALLRHDHRLLHVLRSQA